MMAGLTAWKNETICQSKGILGENISIGEIVEH